MSAAPSPTSSISRPTPAAGRRSAPPRSTPRRPTTRRACSTCSRKAGVDPADISFFAHGTTVVINALTERKGVKIGADHHGGLPRHARDRARQPARFLQPHLREADPSSCRAICAAKCRAASPIGRGARAARPLRPAGHRRRFPDARACRRSPSASSIPTPTRATSRRWSPRSSGCGTRSRSSPRTRSPASGANTSGAPPPCSRPTFSPSPGATSNASRRG